MTQESLPGDGTGSLVANGRSRMRKPRRLSRPKLPMHAWPLWKLLALVVPVSAIWSAFPIIVPPYAKWVLVVCGAMFVCALGSILWLYLYGYNPWAQAILGFSFLPGMFTILASRAWLVAAPINWVWLLPLWGAVLVASLLPLVAPGVSKFLWTEQTAPRTRMGRALMAFCLAVAPAAGTLGAAWGLYGSRLLGQEPTMLGIGVGASILGVGSGFIVSYNVVEWRRKFSSAAGM